MSEKGFDPDNCEVPFASHDNTNDTKAAGAAAYGRWLSCRSLRPPFRLVDADNNEPQGQRQFGDESDPRKIRDWQCKEEPEGVDPVCHWCLPPLE